MPTADITSRQGALFEYTGALFDSGGELLTALESLAAVGVFDGGAPTSTGITIAASEIPGHFELEIAGSAMDVEDAAVITISADGAQDLVLTIRTGRPRLMHIAPPIDLADGAAGGICSETGLAAPASRLKRVNGKRVLDFVDIPSPD